jgi:hypothetical protein
MAGSVELDKMTPKPFRLNILAITLLDTIFYSSSTSASLRK